MHDDRPLTTTRGVRRILTAAALALVAAGSVLGSVTGPATAVAPATTPAAAATPVGAASRPVGPGGYVALPPTRVLDTQVSEGADSDLSAWPRTRYLPVTGRAGVPASGVSAVLVNVTVAAPTSPGYLTVYPAGSPQPLASNLTWGAANTTVAGMVLAKVGSGGRIALTQSNVDVRTRLVVDVTGYVVGDATSAVPGQLRPLVPSRVLDTRSANGTRTVTPVPARTTVHLQVAGRGGVPPTGAGAVVLNVTVTGPAAAGYLTVHPDGTSPPLASTLNFARGQTVANLVVARLSADGKVALTASATTHVVADVAGYVPAGTPDQPGTLTSLAPSRLLDTRSGTGAAAVGPLAAQTTLHLQVAGRGGVPTTGAGAVVLNLTVTGPTSAGYVTVHPDGTTPPLASNLNFLRAQTVANLVVARLSPDGRVAITTSATTHVVADVAGWTSSGWGLDAYQLEAGRPPLLPGDVVADTRSRNPSPPALLPPDASADAHDPAWVQTDCDPSGLCVAVGAYVDGTRDVMAAVRPAGATTWTVSRVLRNAEVESVRCPGGGHCYATTHPWVGPASPVFDLDLATGVWSPVPLDVPDTVWGHSLDCAGPSHCVAVGGTDGSDAASIWTFALVDGRWTTTRTPLGLPVAHHPTLVSRCFATGDCAVFGTSSLGWTVPKGLLMLVPADVPAPLVVLDLPGESRIAGVSCWAAGRCVAVGSQRAVVVGWTPTLPVVLAHLGDVWAPVAAPLSRPDDSSALADVACRSATSCVAVGSTWPRYPTHAGLSAYLLTGAPDRWALVDPGAPKVVGYDTVLDAVQCAPSGRCYVTGQAQSSTVPGAADLFVLHEAA